MKKYLKLLVQKTSVISNVLIGLIIFSLFYFLLNFGIFNHVVKENQQLTRGLIVSLGITIFGFLVYEIKNIKNKNIYLGDGLNTIIFSFTIMMILYASLYQKIFNFKLYSLLFLIILFGIILFFIIRRTKYIKEDEEIFDNYDYSKRKGTLINYYGMLSKEYNAGYPFIFSFVLYSIINYVISLNLNNYKMLIYIVISLVTILGLLYLFTFVKNINYKRIYYFDYINVILVLSTLMYSYNVFSKEVLIINELVAWIAIFIFLVLISISRIITVPRLKIKEKEELTIQEKGLKVYFSKLIRKYNLAIIAFISAISIILFQLLWESNLMSYIKNTNYDLFKLLIFFFIATLFSLIAIILKDINNKEIAFGDSLIIYANIISLTALYIVIREVDFVKTTYGLNLYLLWTINELICLLLLLIRVYSVQIEKIVEAVEVITKNNDNNIDEIPDNIETESEENIEDEVKLIDIEDKNDEIITDLSKKELLGEDEIKKDEQLPINLLTEASDNTLINENIENKIKIVDLNNLTKDYTKYYELFANFCINNELSMKDFSNKHNQTILLSVFICFDDINKLQMYLESYLKKANDSELLGLNTYDAFAINYLLSIYPNLQSELLDNKEFLVANNLHNYHCRLKQNQLKYFEEIRNNRFDKLMSNLNDQSATILSSIFYQVEEYFNNIITKGFTKVEKGRITSKAFFDLYLFDFDFDLLKARRQITKFADEYNNYSLNSESSKCFKEFITSINTLEYFPTLITFIGILVDEFTNKRRFLSDFVKKTNIYYTEDFSKINAIDKVSETIKDLLLSVDKNELDEYIQILFKECDDLLLLDKIYYNVLEQFGSKYKLSNILKDHMIIKIKNILDNSNNLFLNKKFSFENYHIINSYMKNENSFIEYIKNCITEQTVYKYIGSYVQITKNENKSYTYMIDSKSLYTYKNKSELLKIIKLSDTSKKQELVLNLIKNKSLESRMNINFMKV